jgi:hypothetical protein
LYPSFSTCRSYPLIHIEAVTVPGDGNPDRGRLAR